jgi:hypothetical protein
MSRSSKAYIVVRPLLPHNHHSLPVFQCCHCFHQHPHQWCSLLVFHSDFHNVEFTIVIPGSNAGIFMPPIGGCAKLGTVFGVIKIILDEQADLTVNSLVHELSHLSRTCQMIMVDLTWIFNYREGQVDFISVQRILIWLTFMMTVD